MTITLNALLTNRLARMRHLHCWLAIDSPNYLHRLYARLSNITSVSSHHGFDQNTMIRLKFCCCYSDIWTKFCLSSMFCFVCGELSSGASCHLSSARNWQHDTTVIRHTHTAVISLIFHAAKHWQTIVNGEQTHFLYYFHLSTWNCIDRMQSNWF